MTPHPSKTSNGIPPTQFLSWESDADGITTYFRQHESVATGELARELIPDWMCRVHECDRDRLASEFSDAISAQRPVQISYRWNDGDGEQVLLSQIGSPYFDNQRNLLGYVGQCIELRPDEAVYETLIDKKRQLRLILATSPSLIAYVNRELIFEYANENFANYWDTEVTKICGMHLCAVLGEENFQRGLPRFNQAIAGELVEMDIQRQRGGKELFFHLKYVPNKNADGETNGFFVYGIDVTNTIQANEKIATAERRFNLATSGNQVGVWEIDFSNDKRMFCDHLERLLGYPVGHLGNSRTAARSLVHPQDLPELDRARREHVHHNQNYFVEFRALHANGEYIWIRSTGEMERDADGLARRVAGVIFKIDELKRAELKAAQEIRRRDRFLAMLSHELRNPATAINHCIHYAQELSEIPDKLKPTWSILERQVNDLGKLLDDLLDVSRIIGDKIRFEKTTVDFSVIATQAIEATKIRFENKNQTLLVEQPDIPAIVFGDSGRLSQALINLLDNANKYTSPNGVIKVRICERDDQICFSVKDSGCGVPEENQENIFELFYQEQFTLDRAGGGIGVGLFLVKQIANAHDGVVSVVSTGAGEGSEFHFSIPITEETKAEPMSTNGKSNSQYRVTLVEDHADSRFVLTKLFEQAGFEITAYSDGESACEQIPLAPPDIALIDIGLPGRNGFEVARLLREDPRMSTTLLVALTGYGQKSDQITATESGFDEHLTKPVNFPTLRNRIDQWMAKRADD